MKCHICNNYTPETGCAHYEPDYVYETIAKIVAFAHNGDMTIIETKDFKEGIKQAILYFENEKLNNLPIPIKSF